MSTPDLTDYLTGLESRHPEEIRRIKRSVPRDYFLTSLVLKLDQRRQFPVVILDRVEETGWPVVGNLFADRDRIARMVGATRESFSRQWLVAESNRVKPVDLAPGFSTEHLLLGGVGKEARVIERMREALPTLKAINFSVSGTHFHAYLSFKKTAEGQARQALLLLFGLDSHLKLAIAVDDDIDVFSQDEVMWALATRLQADRDVFIVPEVFSNRLDPSYRDGLTAKMGIDATAPLDWDVIRCRTDPDADRRADNLLRDSEC